MPMSKGTRQELVAVPIALAVPFTPDLARREEQLLTGSNRYHLPTEDGYVPVLGSKGASSSQVRAGLRNREWELRC